MRKFYLDFSRKQAGQTAENVDTSGVSADNNTEPKDDIKNPPNADNPYKLQGQRSPWVDAGIGGGVGGLLGAALGYLYGHRGRWLAYDTLAGGLGGGTLGYVIGANTNSNISKNNPTKLPPKDSKAGRVFVATEKRKNRAKYWGDKYDREQEHIRDVNANGGFAGSPSPDVQKIMDAPSKEKYVADRMRAEDDADLVGKASLTNMGINGDGGIIAVSALEGDRRLRDDEAHAASAGLVKMPGRGWVPRSDFSKIK